jgi:hypothetical protein
MENISADVVDNGVSSAMACAGGPVMFPARARTGKLGRQVPFFTLPSGRQNGNLVGVRWSSLQERERNVACVVKPIWQAPEKKASARESQSMVIGSTIP